MYFFVTVFVKNLLSPLHFGAWNMFYFEGQFSYLLKSTVKLWTMDPELDRAGLSKNQKEWFIQKTRQKVFFAEFFFFVKHKNRI